MGSEEAKKEIIKNIKKEIIKYIKEEIIKYIFIKYIKIFEGTGREWNGTPLDPSVI